MTTPEVTREEAAEHVRYYEGVWEADPVTGTLECRLARTVVVLYDLLDAVLSDQIRVAIDTTPMIPPPEPVDPTLVDQAVDRFIAGLTNERAMRECIEHLRDGWHVSSDGLDWWKDNGGMAGTYEPMTPEQQAVMAR